MLDSVRNSDLMPSTMPDEENGRWLQRLIRDRESGGHISLAQCSLAGMYTNGRGVTVLQYMLFENLMWSLCLPTEAEEE
jgi:hypothetical protein